MIGMLILNDAWSEDEARFEAPDNSGKLDRMSRPDFQMSITIQFDEFDCGAKKRRGFFGFSQAPVGRAVRTGFTQRANDKMHRTTELRFLRNHAAATEFDVVGMSAEREQRCEFSL